MVSPDDPQSLLAEVGALRQGLKALLAEQHQRDERILAMGDALARLEARVRALPAPASIPPPAGQGIVLPPPLPGFPPAPVPVPIGPIGPIRPMEAAAGNAAARDEAADETPESGPPPPPPPAPATPREENGRLEMQLGRVWLVRIGIALLLTGLVLLGNYAYRNWIHDLPNIVRLAALAAVSLGLAGAGAWVARRESTKVFGEVVLAGGLAALYYCAYAAHHVPRLRVVESPTGAALLLLAAAAGMVAVSVLRRTQATATLGILLASYATFLNPMGWLSAVSNLLLASAGTSLMARRGWQGPGIASLLGTYGSFALWQVFMNHSPRGPEDLSVLWFLPATWAVFTAPAVLDRFRESMGERARAWFAAFNNAASFLLFAFFWFRLRGAGWPSFWVVPAVFGTVLVALGLFGRKRGLPVGEVNLGQGLAALSLALVIRFEGYHLGLGLAAESLALGLAFARFRRPLEGVFSLAAGWASPMAWAVTTGAAGFAGPTWSPGLAAWLIGGTAAAHRLASGDGEATIGKLARIQSGLLLVLALAMTLGGWVPLLGQDLRAPVVLALASALTVGSLVGDRNRWWPELAWAGSVCLLAGALFLGAVSSPWPSTSISLALAFGLCAAWHRLVRRIPGNPSLLDPADHPAPHAWLASALVPFATITLVGSFHPPESTNWWVPGLLTTALVATAALGRLSRLAVTSHILQALAFLMLVISSFGAHAATESWRVLAPSTGALAVLAVGLSPLGARLVPNHRVVSVFVARVSFVLFSILGWRLLYPAGFGDILALGAVLLVSVSLWRGRFFGREESLAFLAVGVIQFALRVVDAHWTRLAVPDALLPGLGTILALQVYARAAARLDAATAPDGNRFQASVPTVSALSAVFLCLWATQRVVWHFGWGPTAIVWSALGFGLVTAGLALRERPLRQVGFILLGVALLKLFLRDVWQFATFTRVLSFLALGAALVLLGFFYNRFAAKLKEWI